MRGDAYTELAQQCRKRKFRLLICGDRDHVRFDQVAPHTDLTRLQVCRKDGELLVIVKLKERTLDEAAEIALVALALAAPLKRKR